MKLLIVTQIVDKNDPVLGFFHGWLTAFSRQFEFITVVCLKKGEHDLPANVKILSLGKESGQSRLKYLGRFYQYLWRERHRYDAVFVHMNQEYILLAGWWWRLLGKPVYLWRNHPAGNWLTDLAAFFCAKIFCTSRYSYTAKYKKTRVMPVGIDTDLFKPDPAVERHPRSILFLARLAPVKKPDLLLRALDELERRGVRFTADFYGDASFADRTYAQKLKSHARAKILFYPAVPNYETPAIYSAHQIFVNLSPSGMFDKTIFEAAAGGALPLSANANLRGVFDERLLFKEDDSVDLAAKLETLLDLPPAEFSTLQTAARAYTIKEHSIARLLTELTKELS